MSNRGRESSSALRIKAFPSALDQNLLANTWNQLKNAIIEIQNKNNGGLSFEELYRNAYTLVLQKHGDTLYTNTENVVKSHVCKIRDDILKNLNNDFASYLYNSWKDHKTAMIMIRDILMYMDRVYVEQNKMVPVFKMGMNIFVSIVLSCEPIRTTLQERVLELIRLERMGECIPRSKISDISSMLVDLGAGSNRVYEEFFEEPFLRQTKEFYATEAASMLAEKVSTPVFIQRVDMRIEEEKKRVHSYLDQSTEPNLVAVLEDELITKNLASVVDMPGSGLSYMLVNDRLDEITSMYKILNMVRTGPDVMCKVICDYFGEQGKNIVQETGTNNPIKYIQDLIQLKSKFDKILAVSLNNNSLFKNKINKTFEDFINLNPRSSEFLSLLIDEKMKKGTKGMTDSEIDNLFDMCIVLFRYLHEKDVFERYYKQHLAKRLLLGKSQSDELERNMITKLLVECGSMFTNKFENMFRDIAVSKNLDDEFNKSESNQKSGLDISVKVLTAGLWPTERESKKVILPEEANLAFSHNGRKITLQANQGTAELNAIFYGKNGLPSSGGGGETGSTSSAPGGPCTSESISIPAKKLAIRGKNHILQVSTYQMIFLMKFNKKPSYTFVELLNETGIPEKDLIRSLTSLALGKSSQRILIKEPKTKAINPSDSFTVNDLFTSDHHRVKVLNITMKETEPERTKTLTEIDENRRYVIEATIVRIMKTRKTLEHNQLLSEVIEQLNHRFQPTPLLIKSRIESLLERNYLARSESDRKLYNYIS